jgi:hypothetical protein
MTHDGWARSADRQCQNESIAQHGTLPEQLHGLNNFALARFACLHPLVALHYAYIASHTTASTFSQHQETCQAVAAPPSPSAAVRLIAHATLVRRTQISVTVPAAAGVWEVQSMKRDVAEAYMLAVHCHANPVANAVSNAASCANSLVGQ